MLKLRPSNVTVPDGFRFICPEDAYEIKANNKQDWFSKIKSHYETNGYTLPENWREIAEDQVCRTLSGEWCEGGTPSSFINATRFNVSDFIRGTKTLGSFVLSGEKVVAEDLATERALRCSRCFCNVNIPGCTSCSGAANVVMEAKGGRSTKYDHLLKACAICKCSTQAMAWMPVIHLAKYTTPEQLEQHRQIEDCWKAKEIDEFDKAKH